MRASCVRASERALPTYLPLHALHICSVCTICTRLVVRKRVRVDLERGSKNLEACSAYKSGRERSPVDTDDEEIGLSNNLRLR